MDTLQTPRGYEVHKAETKKLSALLVFATGIIQEHQVFVCASRKNASELHVLLKSECLSSDRSVASKNSALAHKVIEAITQAGWTNFNQNGALLMFTSEAQVSL